MPFFRCKKVVIFMLNGISIAFSQIIFTPLTIFNGGGVIF